METREAITVDPRAQRRLHVLNHVLAGALTAAQAAELLELSLRQVRRLLAGYRVEGVGARRREARPYPPDGKAGRIGASASGGFVPSEPSTTDSFERRTEAGGSSASGDVRGSASVAALDVMWLGVVSSAAGHGSDAPQHAGDEAEKGRHDTEQVDELAHWETPVLRPVQIVGDRRDQVLDIAVEWR